MVIMVIIRSLNRVNIPLNRVIITLSRVIISLNQDILRELVGYDRPAESISVDRAEFVSQFLNSIKMRKPVMTELIAPVA